MAFGSRPWLLPAAVLLGVLLAAGVATLLGGLHRIPAPAAPKPAHATVIESARCAQPGARDTVLFVVEGRSYRLPLDACGNPEGIHLDVELVLGGPTPVVRLAGTGPTSHAVAADRLGTLLLALSGLAGALLTVHTSPTHRPLLKLITAVVSPNRRSRRHNARDHAAVEKVPAGLS